MTCPFCASANDARAATCRVCGASLAAARFPTALPAGTRLQGGKYRIDGVLGQGGFGITYRAHSAALDIPVALKEFHPQGASRAGTSLRPPGTLSHQEYSEARRRFADEARVVARLTYAKPNPHIVRVYDVFTENDTEYYAMEFLEGRPLSAVVERQGSFPEADVLEFARQIAGALEDVHAAGMLHRDVKPDNVILTARGAVLIDFGSARAIAAAGRQSVVITPGYAPLEQYASEARRGPFTDVYAFAATLYFALTGREPVPATDRASGVPQPTARDANPRVSRAVSDVVDRAMRMRVDERPQTAAAFLADLGRAAAGGREPARAARPAPAPASPPARVPPPVVVAPSPPAAVPPAPARRGRRAGAQPPVAAAPPAPAGRPQAARADNLWLLWLVAGGLILAGQLRGQMAVSTVGFFGVVALVLYTALHWLFGTPAGRAVLLAAAFAAAYYFLFYLPGRGVGP